MRLSRRVPVTAALATVLAVAVPAPASAAPTMTSDSVFGYNVGAVPRRQPITQVSAVWTVAAATQRSAGAEESVRTWVALGGGCVTYDCLVHDYTGIRVGTEAAVDAGGAVTYRAWYEGPLGPVHVALAVAAGDQVRGTIERVAGLPALWRLTLRNVTSGASWTTTAVEASMLATAQLMVESPVFFDEFLNAYPLMPDLAATTFDQITVNGAGALLRPEERVVTVAYEELDVVGTPSLPQPDGDGFAACAWATSCAVPPEL